MKHSFCVYMFSDISFFSHSFFERDHDLNIFLKCKIISIQKNVSVFTACTCRNVPSKYHQSTSRMMKNSNNKRRLQQQHTEKKKNTFDRLALKCVYVVRVFIGRKLRKWTNLNLNDNLPWLCSRRVWLWHWDWVSEWLI